MLPLHDHRENITRLIDTNTKQPTDTYRYSAFGEETTFGVTLNPWRFASKRVDLESGFSFFGRRYYSPTVGRFLTPDPIGFADGPNLYAYVHNSPMVLVDPYGLFAMQCGFCAYPSITDSYGSSPDSGSSYNQPSDFPSYGSISSDNSSSSSSPIGINGSSSCGDERSAEDDKREDIAHPCGFDSKADMDRFIAERFYSNPSLTQLLIDLLLANLPFEKYIIPMVKEGWVSLKESSLAAKAAKASSEMLKGAGATRNEISCAKQVLLNPPIKITEKGIQHTIERHCPNTLSQALKKSTFNGGENILELAQRGTQQVMRLQENGRYVRTFDIGRSIGTDCLTGQQTSIVTIVTECDGTLVTMYPGAPRGGKNGF